MPNELLRLQNMHNGQKVVPTFSATEMSCRQDGLRKILDELKLDGAVLTSYHNICYFSDFLYCYFGRRYAFVVTADKAVSVSAGIDAGQPWRRTFGDNITYTDWQRDNYFHALQQLLPGARRLGIEFDHVNLDLRRLLQDAFPAVEFVDIGAPTMWLRTIKSAEEIALIKEAPGPPTSAARRSAMPSAKAYRSTRLRSPARRPWCATSPRHSRMSN